MVEDSLDKDQLYDVIIIGAGPAGFIASYESLILGKKVLVIDEGESGRQNYAWNQTVLATTGLKHTSALQPSATAQRYGPN